jgi:hypothetical protein
MSRSQERGVAIFVVVMVLTMLSAIGIFAIRAASMAVQASGYERQNTQNHFANEYGMLATVTELGTSRTNRHFCQMFTGRDTCAANVNRSNDGGIALPCYHLYTWDLQQYVPVPFFSAPGAAPGSLGPANAGTGLGLDGDFVVEITDPGKVDQLVAGANLGQPDNGPQFYQLTLTSNGQVRPAADGGVGNPAACAIAGNETGRAYITVGPILGSRCQPN